MGIAELASKRSKDPHVRHGACIVNSDHIVLGIGYNGLPRGMSDDEFDWNKETKGPYIVHAEENAILNSGDITKLKGSILYLFSEKGYLPCSSCAKSLVQVGIKKVVIKRFLGKNTDHYNWTPTLDMFEENRVEIYKIDSNILDITDLQKQVHRNTLCRGVNRNTKNKKGKIK